MSFAYPRYSLQARSPPQQFLRHFPFLRESRILVPPLNTNGNSFSPECLYKNPVLFTPLNLWAETDKKSILNSLTFTKICPTA
jgi:hypothetical protein